MYRDKSRKQILKRILLVCISLSFAYSVTPASAGTLFIFEPYIGGAKGSGTHNLKFKSGDPLLLDSSYMAGFGGVRISYFSEGLWVGLDGNAYLSHEIESKNNKTETRQWDGQDISTETFEATRYNGGVILGFRRRAMIWGAYYPYSELYVNSRSSTGLMHTGDRLYGTAYGGGIGFTIRPNITLLLEYRHYNYTDTNDGKGTHSSTLDNGTLQDLELSEGIAAISFPLEI